MCLKEKNSSRGEDRVVGKYDLNAVVSEKKFNTDIQSSKG